MTKLTQNTKKLFAKLRDFGLYSVLLVPITEPPQGIKSKVFDDVGALFGGTAGSPVQSKTIGDLVVYVVNILLLVSASIAVIYLIVGGYRYIMAHGNEEETEAAKKTLTSALLGLVIIVLSFAVVTIISTVLLESPGPGTGIGTGAPTPTTQ